MVAAVMKTGAYGCLLIGMIVCSSAAGCSAPGEQAMSMTLKSKAFTHEGDISKNYSCEGADVSPPLQWVDPPEGTRSFCLIMDDPDAPAGIWVHWVVYNIPAQERELREGISKELQLPDGTRQGLNDFSRIGYGGPCPPRGASHRYYFKLYALDSSLDLAPGATKTDVEKAMKRHILAQAQLMGRFKR